MSYRVAVASSDGKVINQHFGRSRQFLVFQIEENDGYQFLELRENIPACLAGDHETGSMQKSVDLISDCSLVLVSQIGRGAIEALAKKNIKVYIIPEFIDDALNKIVLEYTLKN